MKSDNLELDAIRDQQTACDSIGRAFILSSVLASIATFSLGLDSLSSILLADPPSGQQSPSPNRGEDLSLQLLPKRVGNMIRTDQTLLRLGTRASHTMRSHRQGTLQRSACEPVCISYTSLIRRLTNSGPAIGIQGSNTHARIKRSCTPLTTSDTS